MPVTSTNRTDSRCMLQTLPMRAAYVRVWSSMVVCHPLTRYNQV